MGAKRYGRAGDLTILLATVLELVEFTVLPKPGPSAIVFRSSALGLARRTCKADLFIGQFEACKSV